MAQGLGLRTLVALTAAGAALPAHAEEVDAGPLSPPSVLDCAYDAEWDAFRRALQRNVAEGFRSENGVFQMADALISRHLLTFLAFHRSKSNEFFHDCNRDTPQGLVCLYGMLCAFFIHHIYLRAKIEGPEASADESEREVFVQSTNTARLLLLVKNNCLDFFDSSGWPFTLAKIAGVLAPPEDVEAEPPRAHCAAAAPAARWLPPPGASPRAGARIVAYVTGTHSALAKESADMLGRFAGGLLGYDIVPVVEVADDYHCSFMDCDGGGGAGEALLGEGAAARGPARGPVGLRELGARHFRPRWKGLDIPDLPGLLAEFRARLAAHPLGREAELFVCTTPAVLCSLFLGLGRPLLGYLGEPVLLSVREEDRSAWWLTFERMVSDRRNFFACYNPFLASMVEYQTGFVLPTIRLHGLYTEATYSPSGGNRVLVVKGPNICVDSVCLLNRFTSGKSRPPPEECEGPRPCFLGLDELGGLPYRELAAFRAVVMYPYDVALAMFYELYSMGVPILLPHVDHLRFFVFRGLHSHAEYHHVQEASGRNGSQGLAPFVPALGVREWFSAAGPWGACTDFALFPHLLRFRTVAELLSVLAPGATDWLAVSAGMRRFNEEALVRSAGQWASGVSAALAGAAGAERRAWAQK